MLRNLVRRVGPLRVQALAARHYCSSGTPPPDNPKSGPYQKGSPRQQAESFIEANEAFREQNESSGQPGEDEIRHAILQQAMLNVPQLGWSREALQLAAEQQGLPAVAHGIFPRGGIELVEHFYVTCNAELAEQMKEEHDKIEQGLQKKRKTNAFIYDNVKKRISMTIPYRNNWHQAMAMMALPQNAVHSLSNLHALCDDIWYYAGDRSTDMNYYTKRLSLAALYKSTELYFLQDQSPDFEDSWSFLHRRMEDLNTAGSCVNQARQGADSIGEFAKSAFITGQNILGMNNRNR